MIIWTFEKSRVFRSKICSQLVVSPKAFFKTPYAYLSTLPFFNLYLKTKFFFAYTPAYLPTDLKRPISPDIFAIRNFDPMQFVPIFTKIKDFHSKFTKKGKDPI